MPGLFAAEDRIATVEPGRTAILKGPRTPKASPRDDRGPVDPSMPIDYATLYLKPGPGLEAFLADQQNPGSPLYHKWLTPEQFGDRFGLSGNDIGKIAEWLKAQGLQVNDIARGRHWITFSGTASQVGRAFHTEIHRYRTANVDRFANATEISVPAALEGIVTGIQGLDNFTLEPLLRRARLQPDTTSGNAHSLAPDDLAVIYNIAPLYKAGIDGTGQKLVVVGRTDIDLSDIRAFRQRFNLPVNDPQIVLYGPDPGTNIIDLSEADLDLELTGAIARNASIIYVNSNSVGTSAQYAIDRNLAPVMTMSYGGCELSASDTLRSIAQQANAQGITWMISSGDSAAATCDRSSPIPQASKGATVSYPSSIPEVTSVGGTEFDEGTGQFWSASNTANRASALSWIPEKAWNDSVLRDGLLGGGGGASAFFEKPVWQTGPGVPADGARDVPDVSFTSSADHDGYQVYYNGAPGVFGGTSASSPVFAGMIALLNQSLAAANPQAPAGLGNINPTLYRLAQTTTDVFHDVTAGDNFVPCAQGSPNCVNGQVGYAAGPGYDLASGLGSVDAARLVAEWNTGTASTTTLTANPASYSPTDSLELTATVTGAGPAPTGTVTFVAADVTLGTAKLVPGVKSSVASLSADGAILAPGNGTVGAIYSGDATFSESTGTIAVMLKIPPSGSYVLISVNPNPVHQSGSAWPYVFHLIETAGTATTITAFTINGVNNLPVLPETSIPANGSLTTSLVGNNLTVPISRVFHVEGMDDGGRTWSQDLTVAFLAPLPQALAPAIVLSASPSTVQQNPQADPSCQWTQQITVTETAGYQVNLTSLIVSGTSFTSRLSQLFGTTRLAPRGSLTSQVCLTGINPPTQRTWSISGVSEIGSGVSATATSTFTGPAASISDFSVSTPVVTLSAGTGALDLKFGADAVPWTAAVVTRSPWLKVSSLAGTGSGSLAFQASSAGLSNGVYNAVLSIQAAGVLPQSIQIPIVFVVGASPDISITGLGNAASGTQVFAPGQLLAVYGNNLAPDVQIAGIQPLPLTMNGASATVNGVSAPLWFVGPGQMNIQIPYETGAGPAVLGVNNNGKVSSYVFQVAPTAPGIFAYQGSMVPFPSGQPGQTLFGFITGDGDVTPTLASGATPPSGTRLSQFPQPRQPLTMTIGGEQAKIVFNGIVTGLIGVTQVNFTIPADAQPGVQPVVITAGGVSSAPVNLTITAP